MNALIQKFSPEWALRLGLGAMYLYSGYDLFSHPKRWYWAIESLPEVIQTIVVRPFGIDTFLKLQGLGEIALALIFLGWFFPKWLVRLAAVLSTLEMAAILVLTGIDSITFRDLGLVGASSALSILMFQKNKK